MFREIAGILNNHHSTRFLAVREVLVVVGTYMVYSLSKNLIDSTPVLQAFSNAWKLVALQERLGLAQEATIQVWASNYSMGFMAFLAYLYSIGLWVALMGSAILLFAFRRDLYWRLRTVFLITMGVAVIVFALYPVAPPRMLPDYGMTDVVVMLGLNPIEHSDSIFSYNRFAAMPSLHIAWSVLITLAWFKMGWKWGRLLAVAYLGFMTLAVIATANHYIMDVIGGVLLLIFALWMTGLPRRLRVLTGDRDLREMIPALTTAAFPETGYRDRYYQRTPVHVPVGPVGGPPVEIPYWDGALK